MSASRKRSREEWELSEDDLEVPVETSYAGGWTPGSTVVRHLGATVVPGSLTPWCMLTWKVDPHHFTNPIWVRCPRCGQGGGATGGGHVVPGVCRTDWPAEVEVEDDWDNGWGRPGVPPRRWVRWQWTLECVGGWTPTVSHGTAWYLKWLRSLPPNSRVHWCCKVHPLVRVILGYLCSGQSCGVVQVVNACLVGHLGLGQ